MGKTLQELTDKSIVADLIKAHCDELLAWHLYYFMASTIGGNLYPELKKLLDETASEELEHADELADLIVKLGGKPINDIAALEENANFAVIIPPDTIDLKSVCAVVAESEANAIKNYNALALKTKDKDIVVYTLISEILSDETDHEETFENLGAK